MKKIHEVSKVAGVSRRTLQFYDDCGLLVTKRSAENYRLYSREDLERLWQILVYKEMGFELEEIKELLDADESGRCQLLDEHIRMIAAEMHRLAEQIRFAQKARDCGIPEMPKGDDLSDGMTFSELAAMLKMNSDESDK